jgi:hypothetical protein
VQQERTFQAMIVRSLSPRTKKDFATAARNDA